MARVEEVALRAYEVTGCRDYARLDIRLDRDDRPYVLEVNPNPDLTEGVSLMESAEEAGYGFAETLAMVVEWARERGELDVPEVPPPEAAAPLPHASDSPTSA